MKRIVHLFWTVAVLWAVLSGNANAAGKKVSAIKAVDGAWQIIELNGIPLANGENLPFLNFDCLKKAMNGFSGCNYIHGKFEFRAAKSHLRFLPIASTRMFCPDMQTETDILSALQRIVSYTTEPNEKKGHNLLLLDTEGQVVAKLTKMMPLDGKWIVSKIKDSAIDNTSGEIFLVFNSAKETVHGNIGCNTYQASLTCDKKKPAVIRIGAGITTLKMCQDMHAEQEMLRALGSVVSFKKFSDRKAILCDIGGNVLIELTR